MSGLLHAIVVLLFDRIQVVHDRTLYTFTAAVLAKLCPSMPWDLVCKV